MEATEAKLVLHTPCDLVPQIMERIRSQHPYEVPGVRVVTFDTHDDYREWVHTETAPESSAGF